MTPLPEAGALSVILGRVLINNSDPDVRFRGITGHRNATLNRSKMTEAVRKLSERFRIAAPSENFCDLYGSARR